MCDNKGRIAVVDDDEMVRSVIVSILETAFDVVAHERSELLLECKDLSEFDAVITDVNLPGMNGIEMMREIHMRDESLPVIVITGFGDIDTAISALKNGAFDFILKPFNVDQILIATEKAVSRRRLYLENIRLMDELVEKNRQLEKLYNQLHERNVQIERDLDIAGNLQECLFPALFPVIPGVNFFLRMKPVEKISGDFFDILKVSNTKFRMIFADISGHGVPAALYSAMIKSAITSLEEKNLSPCESIAQINRYLIHSQKMMSYSYATVCYCFFNLENGTLTYSNAGIPGPLLLKKTGERVTLDPNGPYVGIFENAVYEDVTAAIGTGDRLFFFTDGAFEASEGKDISFGYNQIIDFIQGLPSDTAGEIVEKVFSRAIDNSVNRSVPDDITVLALKID